VKIRATAAAEHAHAVDAATRPQDRGVFDGQNQLERRPDLAVAAHLMGNPFGTRVKVRNVPFLDWDAANRLS